MWWIMVVVRLGFSGKSVPQFSKTVARTWRRLSCMGRRGGHVGSTTYTNDSPSMVALVCNNSAVCNVPPLQSQKALAGPRLTVWAGMRSETEPVKEQPMTRLHGCPSERGTNGDPGKSHWSGDFLALPPRSSSVCIWQPPAKPGVSVFPKSLFCAVDPLPLYRLISS